MLKNVDWSHVLGYLWHLGLMGGAIALQVYAPQSAQMFAPLLQAAGQVGSVPGLSVYKEPGA